MAIDITGHHCVSDASPLPAAVLQKRCTWAQAEGTPLPLGATWIEEEQAFNFAVYAERAEKVTLLLYSPDNLANPTLRFQFDSLRNKSGRIWHCRISLDQMRNARYYAYSVSGQPVAGLCGFDQEKIRHSPNPTRSSMSCTSKGSRRIPIPVCIHHELAPMPAWLKRSRI